MTVEFSRKELGAIERFLAACTVPLIYKLDEGAGVHGTGTFFEVDGRAMLITAGHVLKDVDVERIGVPDRGGAVSEISYLGHARVHYTRDTDAYDVGVIELLDETFLRLVRSGWHFLGPSNVAEPGPADQRYVVAGYPRSTVTYEDATLTPSSLTQIYTVPYDEEVEGSRGEFDLFLRYRSKAESISGLPMQTPRLCGVSGASVYALLPKVASQVWAPEKLLKIAGIQVSAVHGKYVRAKTWNLVSHVISLVGAKRAT